MQCRPHADSQVRLNEWWPSSRNSDLKMSKYNLLFFRLWRKWQRVKAGTLVCRNNGDETVWFTVKSNDTIGPKPLASVNVVTC